MKQIGILAFLSVLAFPLAAQPRGPAAGGRASCGCGPCCQIPGPVTESDSQSLTESDREALRFMWEEEKLARDTYLYFWEIWSLRPFQQIGGRSEPRHMEAIEGLMARYSVARPGTDDRPGVFSDPQISDLYTSMIARGEQSLAEAIRVAITIEELDIRDLTDRIDATTNDDIRLVFENLRAASVHHLNAFVNQLVRLGEHHSPVYLDPGTFEQLLNS